MAGPLVLGVKGHSQLIPLITIEEGGEHLGGMLKIGLWWIGAFRVGFRCTIIGCCMEVWLVRGMLYIQLRGIKSG